MKKGRAGNSTFGWPVHFAGARGYWISTQIFDDAACEFATASCMGN